MTTRGIYQPVAEPLAALPVTSVSGSCLTNDRTGTGRYIYGFFPTSLTAGANTGQFWRYDTWGDVWQQLATPAVGATDQYGPATMLVDDPSGGFVYMGNTLTAGNFFRWQRYSKAADTWAALNVPAGLAAAFGTCGAAFHPDLSYIPGVQVPVGGGAFAVGDDFIFMVGGAAPVNLNVYQYRISTGLWAVLAGVGAARAAGCATGTSLDMIPTATDQIYSLRGGGSVVLDGYRFTVPLADSWAAIGYVPATETFGVATETCPAPDGSGIFVCQSGTIRKFVPGDPATYPNGRMDPLAHLYGSDGTAHIGRGICATRVGDWTYLYARKHTSTEFQRIRLAP